MKKYIKYKDNEYLVAFEIKNEHMDVYAVFNEDVSNKRKIIDQIKKGGSNFSIRDNKLFYKEIEIKLYFPLEMIKEAFVHYIPKSQTSLERIEYDEKEKIKRKRLITSPL